MMKLGGRCGVVIKSTFLSNINDKASIELRKQLLLECNLYAILDLPQGTFVGSGVKTVVLFFDKGKPTEKILYYQLNLDRNLGKTNPLCESDLIEFFETVNNKEENPNSWFVDISDIDMETWDLSVKNPNIQETIALQEPNEIIFQIEKLGLEANNSLKKIREML